MARVDRVFGGTISTKCNGKACPCRDVWVTGEGPGVPGDVAGNNGCAKKPRRGPGQRGDGTEGKQPREGVSDEEQRVRRAQEKKEGGGEVEVGQDHEGTKNGDEGERG